MCTNYALMVSQLEAAEEFGVTILEPVQLELFPYRPTKSGAPAKAYNLAPVITEVNGVRTLTTMRWGLLPYWSKTDQEPVQPCNAQAEGVAEKSMFRDAFKSRRCLVPASVFFDFDKAKSRYSFNPKGSKLFAFAGLFNVWRDDLYTFTFVTTEPTDSFRNYHHRQPVTLVKEQYGEWLSPQTALPELSSLMTGYPDLEAVLCPKKRSQ